MKKFISLILSLLIVGGGLTLSASAASHSATKCRYVDTYTCTDWYTWRCPGGTTKPCPSKTGGTTTYDYVYCSCGKRKSISHWYTYCNVCGEMYAEADSPYGLTCNDCGTSESSSSRTVTHYSHGTIDVECEHGKMSSHTVTEECEHGYSRNHTQTDYHNCSSSYPCQNGHTSFRTVNHYYCTTHGYVGTSSTCPGLAVSPSPSPMSVYFGQTVQLKANQLPTTASVGFTSSNTGIASVSSTGLVKGLKKGSTSIVVTATL